MKKSMLHRSFKPAKCKTALKLAVSRIKLLKNKRDAQVKVMKRELAQLLQSGQDRTARIRVEHVVMEEKIMTAYELIEIYCELIAARLPIIESQKNCPVDLKEAIASLIFASPRCADIPELMDVRKHLAAKYGKEFVSAALELRPDCGVSRMLVEKLSAKAPDGSTKIKILSAIAEEHNIKWEPKAFEEKERQPPDDLLNGPNTFEKSTMMHGELSGIQTPSDLVKKGPPSSQHADHDAYSNIHQQNSGFSPHSQNVAPHVDAYNTVHHASHPEVRPPGIPVEGGEYRHSYSGVFRESPKTGHNWNMKFKDATAAAQAAAESAERASMAARAAAELSSRGQTTTQYSVDSQRSSINNRRYEAPQDSVGRNLQDEHPSVLSHYRQTASHKSTDSQLSSTGNREEEVPQGYVDRKSRAEHPSGVHSNNNIDGNRNSGMQCNNSNEVEQDTLAGVDARFHNDYSKASNEPSGPASHKYNPTTINDDSMRNPFWMEDSDASKNYLKPEKKEYVNGTQYDLKSESVDTFLQQGIERQPHHASYGSQSGNFCNDRDVLELSNQRTEDCSGNISSVDFDQDEYQERASDKKSFAFDESGSDNDGDYMYDMVGDHKGQHSNISFSSPNRTLRTHIPEIKNFGSPNEYIDDSPKTSISESPFSMNQHLSPVFSDSLTNPAISSQPDDLPPVIFDDLDESSSGEEELHKVKLSVSRSQKGSLTEGVKDGSMGTSLVREENVRSKGKLQFQSSSHSLDPFEGHHERDHGDDFDNESHETFDSPVSLSSRPLMSHRHSNELDDISSFKAVKATEHVQDSTLESGKELNLGPLIGGLRNKCYRQSPYLKNSFGDSNYKQPVENYSVETEPSSSLPVVSTYNISGATYQDPYTGKEDLTSYKKSFDTDDDSFEEETSEQTSKIRQQSFISKAGSGVKEKSSSKVRRAYTYFDSDSDESVENIPKQSLANKGRSVPAFSRRTKASHTSEKSLSKETTEKSSSSSAPEPLPSPQSQIKSSYYIRKFEQPSSANKAATFKPTPEYKSPFNDRNLAHSQKEQSKSSISKATSSSSEVPKTSSSSEKNLSKIDSTTSHVHPKLPDFDNFVAHMKSLHKNRE